MLRCIAALQWMRRCRPLPLQISLPIPGIDASPRCQHAGDGIGYAIFDARQNSAGFQLASAPHDPLESRIDGRGSA